MIQGLAVGCGILAVLVAVGNPLYALRGGGDFMTQLIDRGSMTDGQMLMIGAILAVGLWGAARVEGRSGWGWLGLALLVGLALAINLKRGSWLAALVVLAAFFGRRWGWKAPVGLALFAAAVLLIPAARHRLAELPREFDAHRGGRMTMWRKIAPELLQRHPWGIGYSALTNDRMREVAPEVEMNRNHLHSNPIQIAVEMGWLGLGLYLGWMLIAAAQARRLLAATRWDPPLWAAALALLGLFLNGAVEYNFGDTELLVMYAILFGVMAAPLIPVPPGVGSSGTEGGARR